MQFLNLKKKRLWVTLLYVLQKDKIITINQTSAYFSKSVSYFECSMHFLSPGILKMGASSKNSENLDASNVAEEMSSFKSDLKF